MGRSAQFRPLFEQQFSEVGPAHANDTGGDGQLFYKVRRANPSFITRM